MCCVERLWCWCGEGLKRALLSGDGVGLVPDVQIWCKLQLAVSGDAVVLLWNAVVVVNDIGNVLEGA